MLGARLLRPVVLQGASLRRRAWLSFLVSPCISPGEKEIAKAALEAGRPLIVLLENGFAPLYKPAGRYFEACVSGRLLMVAPFPYHRQKRTITREQCLTLNVWARTFAEMDAA